MWVSLLEVTLSLQLLKLAKITFYTIQVTKSRLVNSERKEKRFLPRYVWLCLQLFEWLSISAWSASAQSHLPGWSQISDTQGQTTTTNRFIRCYSIFSAEKLDVIFVWQAQCKTLVLWEKKKYCIFLEYKWQQQKIQKKKNLIQVTLNFERQLKKTEYITIIDWIYEWK